jgi:two-component system, OmpR family, response regulator
VIRGRVLVIDGDEWTGRLCARVLQEHGYVVEICGEARAGFRRACEAPPDCIVCNPDLPDIDGTWVARHIRTEPGSIARVPMLFVGEVQRAEDRVQAIRAGADVFLARPVSNEEVVAHVDALVGMVRRMGPPEAPPSSASEAAAIRGDLSMFPLATILMMFEMERKSGTVEVVATSGRRAKLTLDQGHFSNTEVGGEAKPALQVLREVLSWRAGRFAYVPKTNVTPGALRVSVGALVLEAMRLEDEKKAAP